MRRDERVLLVASRYPNLAEPLWHLPGGRPRDGETRRAAALRELTEETGLQHGAVSALAYGAESFDPAGRVHVVSFTFVTSAEGSAAVPEADAHVVDVAWVPIADLAKRMAVAVVRDPLIAYLAGDARRYYEFTDARISIEFADEA